MDQPTAAAVSPPIASTEADRVIIEAIAGLRDQFAGDKNPANSETKRGLEFLPVRGSINLHDEFQKGDSGSQTTDDKGPFPYKGREVRYPRPFADDPIAKLTYVAHARLTENLRAYGNELSQPHNEALQRILLDMSRMAYGQRQGRYGYPLPTGGGKTQAAVCWAWAATKIDPSLSVTIASSRIDNLQELHGELIKLGVSSELIGVLHADKEHSLKSSSVKAAQTCPILLVTHARLAGGTKNLDQYAYFKGQKRSLFIWDESLVPTSHWSANVSGLVKAVGGAKELCEVLPGEMSGVSRAAYQYLEAVKNVIQPEIGAFRGPSRLAVPDLPVGYEVETLVEALDSADRERLGVIFKYAGQSARVLNLQGQAGLISFSVTVPDEIDNLIVLDASLMVRLLPDLAEQVKRSENFPEDIISYENVTLYHLPEASGRGWLTGTLTDRYRLNAYTQELARVLTDCIASSEAVNIWTFKARPNLDYVERIRAGLAKHGVDLSGTIAVDGERRPRLNFLTWGQETASNAYGYANHTVFAGVLHREQLELGAATVAAHRDLLHEKNLKRIADIKASEVAHVIYQAASRSGIRYHENGRAKAGTIWLPCKTAGVLDMLLENVWPGINATRWARPRGGPSDTKTDQAEREIICALETCPVDRAAISAKAIRQSLRGVSGERIWRTAQARVAANPPCGWAKSGRSFVRAQSGQKRVQN